LIGIATGYAAASSQPLLGLMALWRERRRSSRDAGLMVSLLDATRDPALLGATLTLWPRQVELLRGLEDPTVRTHLLACGRQSSKSTLSAMLAVHEAVLRADLDAVLPRGRTRYVLVAAPSEDQAREFVSLCAGLVEASPLLAPLAAIKADRIDFRMESGAHTAIRALAANSRAVRGMSASLVVLDEFAHFSDTAGPASDERMFNALEPSLRVFGEAGRLVLISTPFGEVGKFYELCQAAEAGTLPGARLTHAATWEVDPSLDEKWKDRKRAELGDDVFRQEYGAEFVAGAGQFFDLREIEFEQAPFRPEDAREWVVGLDPAFHSDRFACACVGESLTEPGVFLVGDVAAIDPGQRLRSWEQRREREDRTLAEVWAILEPYQEARPGLKIVSDQHQADGIRSFFERRGAQVEIVNVTAPIQTAAFVSMRARLVDGSLRCWNNSLLLEDLRRVRTARTAESVVLPRYAGGHCDASSALALGCYAVREGSHPPAAAVTVAPAGVVALHRRYSDSVFG
jgi:phage terminase large subunit-like protein